MQLNKNVKGHSEDTINLHRKLLEIAKKIDADDLLEVIIEISRSSSYAVANMLLQMHILSHIQTESDLYRYNISRYDLTYCLENC